MTRFYVKVNTDENEFHIDTSGTYPCIDLTSPAKQGRANDELVQRMTKVLGEPVGIVSGHTSQRKQLAADLPEDEIHERLKNVHE